jgi:Skp family chaperone for outer membrane proteins
LIERYTESRDNSCSDTLYNEFLKKKTVWNISKYKIETDLTDFLNNYLDNIIAMVNSKPGMGTKEISEYIYKLHEIDQGHQNRLDEINAEYHRELDKLKAEKAVKDRQYREFRGQWKKFLRAYDYLDNYPKKQQALYEGSASKVKVLETTSMKEIYDAAEAFRNKPSNSFSLIDYFSNNKSTQNLPNLNNMRYPETLDGKASIILNEVKRMNDLNDIEIRRMQEASDIQERFGDYSFEEPQNKQNFSRTSSQDTIKPIKPKPKQF